MHLKMSGEKKKNADTCIFSFTTKPQHNDPEKQCFWEPFGGK